MPELQLGIDARGAKAGAAQFNKAVRGVNRGVRTLIGSLGGLGAIFTARGFMELSDTFVQVNNRIRLVTKSTAEFNAVQARLLQQSKQNFIALESQGEVFQRVAKGAGEAGFSTEQALQATEAVAAAVRLSGVSAEAARNAIVQFGQGLAAGALRGDELRSVLEQTPRLADALAAALDTTTGKLRALGSTGAITTEKIIPGLIEQLEILRAESELLNPTFSQAFQNLRTSAVVAIADFNAISGAAGGFTDIIEDLGDFVEQNLPEALAIFSQSLGLTFDFVKDFGKSATTIFDLFAESIEGVAPSFIGLEDSFISIANLLPDMIALFKLFSTEIVAGFAIAETKVGLFIKNVQIAAAQTAGETSEVARLTREFNALNDELQVEEAFRIANIAAILGERDANIENRKAAVAAAEQARKARAAALDDLEATKGRAGGFDEDAPSSVNELSKAMVKLLETTRGPFGDFLADFTELNTLLGAQFPDNFRRGVTELFEDIAGSKATLDEFRNAIAFGQAADVKAGSIDFMRELGIGFDDLIVKLERFREVNPGATTGEFIEALQLADTTTNEMSSAQERLNLALTDYRVLLDAGLISQETFDAKQKELIEDITGLGNVMEEFALEAARNIQSAFADFLFDPFDEGLKGLASNFTDTLRKMVAELLAQQILKAFLNSIGGGAGGLIGGLASSFAGGKAGGGRVNRGEVAVVGEREAELFAPDRSGTVLNGDQMAGLMPQITNNVIIDPKGFTGALGSPQGSRDLIQAITINKRAISAALQ